MLYTRPGGCSKNAIRLTCSMLQLPGLANDVQDVFTEPSQRLFGTIKICELEKLVMADRETGTVKWFNDSKGYGFIQRESGPDVFVHYRAIRGEGHRTLVEGPKVEFGVTQGQKGLQAEDVSAL